MHSAEQVMLTQGCELSLSIPVGWGLPVVSHTLLPTGQPSPEDPRKDPVQHLGSRSEALLHFGVKCGRAAVPGAAPAEAAPLPPQPRGTPRPRRAGMNRAGMDRDGMIRAGMDREG